MSTDAQLATLSQNTLTRYTVKNEFVACHARASELHPLSFVRFLYSDDG